MRDVPSLFLAAAEMLRDGAPAIDDVPLDMRMIVRILADRPALEHDALILIAEILRRQRGELFERCAAVARAREENDERTVHPAV